MEHHTRGTFDENFEIGDCVLVQYKDAFLPVLEILLWRDVCKTLISQQQNFPYW